MEKIMAEMRPEQIEAFKLYLLERENAGTTIQKYLTDIRTFFGYLGKERMVDKQRLLSYKEWLQGKYMVNSINSMLAALNQFMEFLDLGGLKVRRLKV